MMEANKKPCYNIVLVRPEIPQNTGTIGRLCVCTDAALHLIKPLLHLHIASKGLSGLVTHGGVILDDHHLWQIADGQAMRYRHMARRGLLHAAEYLKKGGLPCTVLAHQCDAVAVVDDKAGIMEEGFHPKLHLEIFDWNHRIRNVPPIGGITFLP